VGLASRTWAFKGLFWFLKYTPAEARYLALECIGLLAKRFENMQCLAVVLGLEGGAERAVRVVDVELAAAGGHA